MHDIKCFFSIKIIRQFRGAKKFSGEERANYQGKLPKITIFQNSEGHVPL
jgi:hypothetical protein